MIRTLLALFFALAALTAYGQGGTSPFGGKTSDDTSRTRAKLRLDYYANSARKLISIDEYGIVHLVRQDSISGDTTSLSNRIDLRELLSNKSTSTSLGTSNTLYPSQNAVKTYVDNAVAGVGVPAVTTGAVTFGSGSNITYDAAKLFWNNTDKWLSIDTNGQAVWSTEIVKAAVTITGGGLYVKNPTGESRFINSRTSGLGGASANVMRWQHNAPTGSVASIFSDSLLNEWGAVGYQLGLGLNSFFLNNYVFLAASSLNSSYQYINNKYPPGIGLAQQGYNGSTNGKEVLRLDIDSLWQIRFRDKNGNVQLHLPADGGFALYDAFSNLALQMGGSGGFTSTGSTNAAALWVFRNTNTSANADQTLQYQTWDGSATTACGIINATNNNYSFSGYGSRSFSMNAVGSGGLNLMASHASGAVKVFVGGTAASNVKFQVKSTGIVNVGNAPEYADNAAALAGGLVSGDLYKTSGDLKIVQ